MQPDATASNSSASHARGLVAGMLFAVALSGCSGGGNSASSSSAPGCSPPPAPPPPPPMVMSTHDAARFLTQATFGPTDASINAVAAGGLEPWLAAQLSTPAAANHRTYID